MKKGKSNGSHYGSNSSNFNRSRSDTDICGRCSTKLKSGTLSGTAYKVDLESTSMANDSLDNGSTFVYDADSDSYVLTIKTKSSDTYMWKTQQLFQDRPRCHIYADEGRCYGKWTAVLYKTCQLRNF